MRAGNLFEPVPGDQGPHGPFDARAKGRSTQLWVTKNRRYLGLAGAAALVAAAAGTVTGADNRAGSPPARFLRARPRN